jgi:hypothetical protein
VTPVHNRALSQRGCAVGVQQVVSEHRRLGLGAGKLKGYM